MACIHFLIVLISIQLSKAQITCDAPPQSSPFGYLEKLSAISKYFHFDSKIQSPFTYTYDKARRVCESEGLQMAEVTSSVDLRSLNAFISDVHVRYWLGINDREEEGNFVESDGSTKIQFQQFFRDEPNDIHGFADCVQIKRIGESLYMDDVGCDTTAGVLCQFPEGSYCHINSFQKNAQDVQALVPIGSGFYISPTQKPRNDAFRECLHQRKYLVSLHNAKLNRDLLEDMKSFNHFSELHPEVSFWTSGLIINETNEIVANKGPKLYWESTEITYDFDSNPEKIEFEWGHHIPYDTGSFGEDGCLDISFPMSVTYNTVWRPSNCLLPKYFICMDLNITVSQEKLEERWKQLKLTKEKTKSQGRASADSEIEKIYCDKEVKEVAPPDVRFDANQSLPIDDTIQLMLFVLENDIKRGFTKIKLKEKIEWKRELVELIFNIFKAYVPAKFVPRGFLNVAQELNLFYQNELGREEESVSHDDWDNVQTALQDCLKNAKDLSFATEGLTVAFVNASGNGEQAINPPEELADQAESLDLVLDVMWHVFSFSLGLCYPYSLKRDPSAWGSQYYILFNLDFLEDLERKWVVEDDLGTLKQSLLFGDFDVDTHMHSIRNIATSAYMYNDILDRLVVRPISLYTLSGQKPPKNHVAYNHKVSSH